MLEKKLTDENYRLLKTIENMKADMLAADTRYRRVVVERDNARERNRFLEAAVRDLEWKLAGTLDGPEFESVLGDRL